LPSDHTLHREVQKISTLWQDSLQSFRTDFSLCFPEFNATHRQHKTQLLTIIWHLLWHCFLEHRTT